jgi:hypothetical protein
MNLELKKLNRKVHTTVIDVENLVSVTYHATTVASLSDGVLVLNSGGWLTATTKSRINEFCDALGLPVKVYQFNFDWYVKAGKANLNFVDGMTIDVTGLGGLQW